MYYYSTVDDVITTYSKIEKNNQGFKNITVHFERPRKDKKSGFDFAGMRIPEYTFFNAFGFDEDELMQLEKYAKNNTLLIWELAEEKGEKRQHAKSNT